VGSSPDEVDFFDLPVPSSRTTALASTQPLTEMSTRSLPGGKGRQCVRLTTSPPSVSRLSKRKMWVGFLFNKMTGHMEGAKV
jgi:hypothetical protein